MATLEEVTALVHKVYDQIWTDWYAGIPGAHKATVEVPLSDSGSGYSREEHRLINPVGQGSLDDYDILHDHGWPIWKVQLVHEMLHEWQYKKPCQPAEAAVALHAKYKNKFWGPGHGPDFFQAIVEKAHYFCMNPEELVWRI